MLISLLLPTAHFFLHKGAKFSDAPRTAENISDLKMDFFDPNNAGILGDFAK
jgi:hypothetical protein